MPAVRMRVIRPRRVNYAASIEQEIANEAEKAKREMMQAYEDLQKNFKEKNKAEVRGRKYVQSKETRIVITYQGGTLGWIDLGTEGPYKIVAKNAPLLRFRGGYKPLTLPGGGAFGGGGTTLPRIVVGGQVGATGDWVSKKEVTHPGIKPRKFTEHFAEFWREEWPKRMDAAIKRGKRRAER